MGTSDRVGPCGDRMGYRDPHGIPCALEAIAASARVQLSTDSKRTAKGLLGLYPTSILTGKPVLSKYTRVRKLAFTIVDGPTRRLGVGEFKRRAVANTENGVRGR